MNHSESEPLDDESSDDEFMEREFLEHRERLFGLAYRICGTRTDADDVMQEAWLRWSRADRSDVERPAAWLTTVTSRLAIDRLRARRRESERYVGPWLPEMVTTAHTPDHSDLIDSLTVGFLTLLERLEPVERVVFLLADVFHEPFVDISTTVGRSEAACRQIASRARRRVHDPARRRVASSDDQERLAAAFGAAVFSGDLDALRALLHPEAVMLSDGGAQVHAARRPIVGPERIGRFLVNLARRYTAADTSIGAALLNGEPGVIITVGVEPRPILAVVVHSAIDDTTGSVLIDEIYGLRNPDKLLAVTAPDPVR